MSIILKGNDSVGGPNIPPENVSNVKFTDNKKGSVNINWKDPDDIVLEGVNISTWQKTVLVYKQNSEPISITDGTVIENYDRNKYMNTPLNITITPDVLYHFKFFTVNDKNKVNSSDKSYSFTSKGVSTTLKDNDWSTIIDIANKGQAQNYWNIGDKIDLVLKGTLFNETITLQIWDFNHFDKSNGSGKANICFGMKNLMKDKQYLNTNATNNGGWNNTSMRNNIMNNIFNSMPIELKNHIKEVKTEANRGGNTSLSQLSKDKVFLPGFTECGGTWNNYDGNQSKFPIFTDDKSRIKIMSNGYESAESWWTRSPRSGDDRFFCYFYSDGSSNYNSAYTSGSFGVCVCFNV